MSLSNPKPTNPCKKFIEFKGDSGIFQYWDKVGEKNVELKSPVTFIVLDELSTIRGFSDEFGCGIYANEVRSLVDEQLNVRLFKGNHRIIGKYSDIKGEVGAMGGKFCKSVYAAMVVNEGKDLELVNFQMKGAALKAWMDVLIDKSAFGITVEDCSDGKKGKVSYKIPNFKQASLDLKMIERAVVMDRELQRYLKDYLNTQVIKPEVAKPATDQSPEDDDIPF